MAQQGVVGFGSGADRVDRCAPERGFPVGPVEGGMEGGRAVAWLEAEVMWVVRREEVGMEAIWEAVVHVVASLAHPWAE